MQFNHDNMSGVWLAEELVNMQEAGTWDIPALQDLLTRYLFRQPELDIAAVRELLEWAPLLRSVFDAPPDEEARCRAVNILLDQGVRRVFLTTHDGMLPHMHFADTGDSVVERLHDDCRRAGHFHNGGRRRPSRRLREERMPAGFRGHQPRWPPRLLLGAVRQQRRRRALPRPARRPATPLPLIDQVTRDEHR